MEKKQREDENYYKSDFLLAKEARISFGNPEITFRHLPAKVVVNVKAGDGVAEADMSNLRVSIHNHFSDELHLTKFTSGKINPTDGTVEPLPDGVHEDSLYMNALPRPASGFIKSFRALLVPQTLTKGVPFFKFYTIQQGWFYYTPQSDGELSLEPGKKYVYNITVMKDGLSVVRYEDVDEWNTEEKDIYRKETQTGYRAQDLKPFDYYYSDGTWSDGGYRRYTDGTEGWLDIAPTEGKKVIGIVFQADKNRMSQAEKSKGWERGYAVSVTVCGDYPLDNWNQWEWGVGGSNITDMENDALTTFIACKNFIFGYEATRKVINEVGKGEVEALKGTEYEAFYQACQYGKTDYTKPYAAPENSSGWYLPSVGQWWDIVENLFGCKLEAPADAPDEIAYKGQDKPYVKKNIKTQLNWIPGAQNFTAEYWTSSIYDKDYAWYVRFEHKNGYVTMKDTISLNCGRKDISRRVRAVIAF